MNFNTPPVVKNLIIINILFFCAQELLPNGLGESFTDFLGLHYIESPKFQPFQIVTNMFLHGGIEHLFANMFGLWMFGRILEYDLGSKRFLTYYMVTGIGAALLHSGVLAWEGQVAIHKLAAATVAGNIAEAAELQQVLGGIFHSITVGASGAVFGILLGFGMMHPNDRIMLLFPPIPMKAKYFVIGYGVIELGLGISGAASNIAHFAHIGGMIFGIILLLYWKKRGKIYY